MENISLDLVGGTRYLCGVWSASCEHLHCPTSSLGYSNSKPVPAIPGRLSSGHSSRTAFWTYSSFKTIGALAFLQTGRLKARAHLFQLHMCQGMVVPIVTHSSFCPGGDTGNPLNISPLSSILHPICGSTRFLFSG